MASREEVIRKLEIDFRERQTNEAFMALTPARQAHINELDRLYINKIKSLPHAHFRAMFDAEV